MTALAGADLPFLEGGGGSGGDGDGGADGGAGDGAPIANADLQFTDINGKVVKTKTDAKGYYRISLRGLKAPLVATVLRDSKPWKSMLIADIVRAPANRKFYTINLTGLTDFIVSEVAKKDGLSNPDAITPAAIVRQKAQVPTIVAAINSLLSNQISAAGLTPGNFDPLTKPYQAVLTDSYDKLLESLSVVRSSATGFTTAVPGFRLGGSVSGLGAASGLSLRNGSETLAIAANATSFAFATKLVQNESYNITVASQPAGATCAVNKSKGTMGTSAITDVAVVCSAATSTVGGSISGLGSASGLQLSNNGAQTITIAANQTSFNFTGIVPGEAYSVAVQTQPTGLTCSVAGGSGTLGSTAVNNVQLNCSANSYPLGGTVSGLSASGLVLSTGGQTLNIASGSNNFTFATPIASGSSYSVAVQTQPTNLTCSVSNGTGTVTTGAVSSVAISCSPNQYAVGGSVSGLSASGLVLATSGQTLSIPSGSTSFAFAAPIASGSAYNVVVQTQPSNLTCSISNGSGSIASSAVTNVAVNCSANSYPLGGTISGLTGGGMVLASGTGQTLTVNANSTAFTFATPVAAGASYAVSVQTQPAGQTCSVTGGTGSISAGPVTSVQIACSNVQYTVTATISGLTGTGLVLSNGSQTFTIAPNSTSNVNFGPYQAGATFSISVSTQPSGQTCAVSPSSGVVSGSSLNSVTVTCSATTGPTVTTLAGSGVSGFANGTGSAASFANLYGVALDSSGNAYVADQSNHAIRKITPAGVVTTMAGNGTSGFANGTGTAASFNRPVAVAVDGGGNVYVVDYGNQAIRKISSAGVVSTLAGSGTSGFVNGTGAAASFNNPVGVAVDSSGNVYVVDNGNQAIRAITSAGVVSTLVGNGGRGFVNGTGTAASFNNPSGVAVDSSGSLYVSDGGNSAIRKISSGAVVSTLAGGSQGFVNGTGTAASFSSPYGVAVDSAGNVYVAEYGNNAIRKITSAGVVSTLAGGSQGFANGIGTAASFSTPTGVAVDTSGNVYVADYGNNAIRKIVP